MVLVGFNVHALLKPKCFMDHDSRETHNCGGICIDIQIVMDCSKKSLNFHKYWKTIVEEEITVIYAYIKSTLQHIKYFRILKNIWSSQKNSLFVSGVMAGKSWNGCPLFCCFSMGIGDPSTPAWKSLIQFSLIFSRNEQTETQN